MCFFTREKSLPKAFLLLLILTVGDGFSIASAQTKSVVNRKERASVSATADAQTNNRTVAEKPLVASVLPTLNEVKPEGFRKDIFSLSSYVDMNESFEFKEQYGKLLPLLF